MARAAKHASNANRAPNAYSGATKGGLGGEVVGVGFEEGLTSGDGLGVGEAVGEGEGVGVGVGDGVGERDGLGVGEAVGAEVGEISGEAVDVGVCVGEAVGDEVGALVGVESGVGDGDSLLPNPPSPTPIGVPVNSRASSVPKTVCGDWKPVGADTHLPSAIFQ